MAINKHLSIITLNVNGLNAPTKRYRVAGAWKSKNLQYAVYKRLILGQRRDIDWKWGDGKKMLHANGPDKIDLKMYVTEKDKEGHYLMIKGSIQGDDVTIVNIYAPNIGAPRYIQRILTDIKGENYGNTIVGDFKHPKHQWTDTLDWINKAKGA